MERKKKILIVEDEMILSLVLEKMVSQMGHQVIDRVASGEAAVQKAFELQPDIILMDIRLKGKIDGIEAVTQIQKKLDVPVIYITGNTDKKYTDRVKQTNYVDFLIKPINKFQLCHSFDLAS